jgi:hypothetical protein
MSFRPEEVCLLAKTECHGQVSVFACSCAAQREVNLDFNFTAVIAALAMRANTK